MKIFTVYKLLLPFLAFVAMGAHAGMPPTMPDLGDYKYGVVPIIPGCQVIDGNNPSVGYVWGYAYSSDLDPMTAQTRPYGDAKRTAIKGAHQQFNFAMQRFTSLCSQFKGIVKTVVGMTCYPDGSKNGDPPSPTNEQGEAAATETSTTQVNYSGTIVSESTTWRTHYVTQGVYCYCLPVPIPDLGGTGAGQ